MEKLDEYPFSGHCVIMGVHEQPWQKEKEILAYFGGKLSSARDKYKEFVSKGIDMGRRDDLVGGGLIRSAGGWVAVKKLRKSEIHVKSDERILGDGDFVSKILQKAEESFERRYRLEAHGVDVDFIAKRVAALLNIPEDEIWREGKFRHLVRARSLLCFWAVRELGVSMASLGRQLNISTVAVSKSVARGADIAKKERFELI